MFKKGHIPWNLGLTKETNKSIKQTSERMKKNNPAKRKEVRKKISIAHKGKPSNMVGFKHSEKTKQKISNSVRKDIKENGFYWQGKRFTKEHCQNLSISHSGKSSVRKGIHLSKIQKMKISDAV